MIQARPNVPYLVAFRADSVPEAYYTIYDSSWVEKQAKTEFETYEGNIASSLITFTEDGFTGFIKMENSDGSQIAYDTILVESPVTALDNYEGQGE